MPTCDMAGGSSAKLENNYYDACPTGTAALAEGVSAVATDCDDAASTVHPAAVEVADDAIDQDCDGADLMVVVECTEDCEDKPCGCASGAAPSAIGLAALAFLFARRRRA